MYYKDNEIEGVIKSKIRSSGVIGKICYCILTENANLKFSFTLIKHHAMKTYRVGGISPHILDLKTRCR
jgi:hypothetical protein